MTEPTTEQIKAFRDAWQAANADGRAGERVRDGLRAALSTASYVEVDGLAMCAESGAPINDGDERCTDWAPGDDDCLPVTLFRRSEATEPAFTVETYRTTTERPDGDTVTEYRWRVRARNHEVLCSGEGYTRAEARDDAVALLWPGITPVEVAG